MAVRVGINGFGRIGRNVFRAASSASRHRVGRAQRPGRPRRRSRTCSSTTRTTGRFQGTVEVTDGGIAVNGKEIRVLAERDPGALPWGELGADVVIESTGFFTDRENAAKHLACGCQEGRDLGARHQPGRDGGAGRELRRGLRRRGAHVISNASCTTNCLAPVAKVLNDTVGIKHGLMTTIHAYTADQRLQDMPHKDLRRARAAAVSLIPATTGAAKAIGLVIPSLNGKLNGFAVRAPVPTGSVVDLTIEAERETTVDEINGALKAAASRGPDERLPRLHRGPDRVGRHRQEPGLVNRGFAADVGARRDVGEGGRLVRQRVGLLEPRRGSRRAALTDPGDVLIDR